jgi:hypothetical protein
MAKVWLKNFSERKIMLTGLRDMEGQPLVFNPGEQKGVHPTTVKHPAVRVFLGKGLQLVEEIESPKQKAQEVTLPAPQPAPAPVPTPVVVPAVEEVPVVPVAPATPVGTDTPSEPVVESVCLPPVVLVEDAVDAPVVEEVLPEAAVEEVPDESQEPVLETVTEDAEPTEEPRPSGKRKKNRG